MDKFDIFSAKSLAIIFSLDLEHAHMKSFLVARTLRIFKSVFSNDNFLMSRLAELSALYQLTTPELGKIATLVLAGQQVQGAYGDFCQSVLKGASKFRESTAPSQLIKEIAILESYLVDVKQLIPLLSEQVGLSLRVYESPRHLPNHSKCFQCNQLDIGS